MSFKNDMGHFLLKAIFYEETLSDKSSVLYTLKDHDHEGYPSLYRLYMEADDPTEYLFATKYLSGWAHWERLCECSWFKPFVARWRRELELRTRAKALKRIQAAAIAGGKEAHQADKFLVNAGWKPASRRRAGAPSKEEVHAEVQRQASVKQTLEDDFNRITGTVQ